MRTHEDSMSNKNRVWHFNIDQTRHNKPFLKIYLSSVKQSASRRDCIRIFDNEIEAFSAGLIKSMIHFQARKMYTPPNAYKPWTIVEEEKLEVNFAMGTPVSELAIMLGRSEAAIHEKILHLRIEEKYIV